MAEAEARALGSGVSVTVGEKEFVLSPLEMAALGQVQREAVAFWKSAYLKSFVEGIKLADLDPDVEQKLILDKVDEVSKMDIGDIPKKDAFDVSRVPIETDALFSLLEKETGERPNSKRQAAAL